MQYGPLYIIDHTPYYLAEFNELLAPPNTDDWIRHLGLTELPIKIDDRFYIRMLDYTPWDGVRGFADYPVIKVPSILVHQGIAPSIAYRFVAEIKAYKPLQ